MACLKIWKISAQNLAETTKKITSTKLLFTVKWREI